MWWAILVLFNHLGKNSRTNVAALGSKIQNFTSLSLLGSLMPCLLFYSAYLPFCWYEKKIPGTLSCLHNIISCAWWHMQQLISDGSSLGKIWPTILRVPLTKISHYSIVPKSYSSSTRQVPSGNIIKKPAPTHAVIRRWEALLVYAWCALLSLLLTALSPNALAHQLTFPYTLMLCYCFQESQAC